MQLLFNKKYLRDKKMTENKAKKMKRLQIESCHYCDYQLIEQKNAEKLIILLHGYAQSAEIISKSFQEHLPKDCHILIPNAPFPIPKEIFGELSLSFAWYFFDTQTSEYYFDFKVSSYFILNLVKKLKLENLPTTVIGFSQGGYLAPFVAEKLNNPQKVIGINCRFRADLMALPQKYQIYGIHGEDDPVVDLENAQKSHREMIISGMEGEFIHIPKAKHKLNKALLDKTLEIANLKT
jgi:predicted esterase